MLTHCEDVYPRGENAYKLANPHNFQSMFKAGQLLHAIVLDSASLLVSIRHGLQTDPTHDPTLHAFESALTQPPPSQLRLPRTPGLFHKMATSFATRDCSMSPTIRRSDWTSFALTTTIVWLDTLASPKRSRTSVVSSIGPEWSPSSPTTSTHARSAVAASPSITSPMAPTDSSRSANNLGTQS